MGFYRFLFPALLVGLISCRGAFGDFQIDLNIDPDGSGKVEHIETGNIYSSDTLFNVTGASALLTAYANTLQLGSVADQTINDGDNLVINVGTQLGSEFKEWLGGLVNLSDDRTTPSLSFLDPLPDPFVGVSNVTAVFTPHNLTSAQVRFNGGAWQNASSFLYSTGNTNIVANWSLLSGSGVSGNGNGVEFRLFDSKGNSAGGSFDLDVFSPSSVPEPSSLALLAIGGALVGWRRRKMLSKA